MAKNNSNKATLLYSAQWDNDFNEGYRVGYKGQVDLELTPYNYNRAYKEGYDVGASRRARECANGKSITVCAFSSST